MAKLLNHPAEQETIKEVTVDSIDSMFDKSLRLREEQNCSESSEDEEEDVESSVPVIAIRVVLSAPRLWRQSYYTSVEFDRTKQ